MVDRITLAKDIYTQVDGQWNIVLGGSVIDVHDATKFAPAHLSSVQKNTGTLVNNKPTGVTVKTK